MTLKRNPEGERLQSVILPLQESDKTLDSIELF